MSGYAGVGIPVSGAGYASQAEIVSTRPRPNKMAAARYFLLTCAWPAVWVGGGLPSAPRAGLCGSGLWPLTAPDIWPPVPRPAERAHAGTNDALPSSRDRNDIASTGQR